MWPTRGLPLLHPPAALLLITLLQAACYVAVEDPRVLGLRVPSEAKWPAQTLTSLLAHAGPLHLAGNAASQLALGALVEGLHGSARFAVVYAAGGALGAACFRVAREAEMADGGEAGGGYVLVGASPAVYALLGAHAAHVALNWAEVPLRRLWLAAVALTAAVDVALYVVAPLPNVAYSSHAGGAAFGVAIGVVALRNVRVLAWERALRRAAAVLLLLACIVLA